MTDREAFLRAIRAHPDDDTPRLIYADWLDEHGDPAQAEFVRLQIELEPIRDQLDQPRVRELAERESILLATHGHDWLGPAAELVGPYPAFGPVFRRGLPEMVCLSLGTFLERAAELFAACPTVREVCLYGVQGHEEELAMCSQLGQIETLEIADPGFARNADGTLDFSLSIRDARLRCLRIAAHTAPFIYQLCHAIVADWPRWVEFVQYRPGVETGCEEFAAALDRIARRPATRILRPHEKLFPLDGDLGHGLIAGRLAHGTPAIVAPNAGRWSVHTFDEEGRWLNETGDTERGFRTPAGSGDVLGWVRAHRGFETGFHLVHEFVADWSEFAVRLWPRAYINDYLANPFDRPPGVSDHWWESRGGVLKRWLHEGRFVIEWDGREYTADATGKIVAG
jgi:uncharacterized protein (TIGR02996 family)